MSASLEGSIHHAVPPARYWEERAVRYARQGDGLAAICSYGMPGFYNRAIDWTQRRALMPYLAALPPRQRVLDVGCGVGRWSLELARRGHEVTGLDLSPTMIARARESASRSAIACDFHVGDITALDRNAPFDLILSVTVVQHVLDEAQAQASIADLGAMLSPNGTLLLLEVAPSGGPRRCNTHVFTARRLAWYERAFTAANLELVETAGVDPAPFKLWLLPHYKRLPRWFAVPLLAVATALALPVDLLTPRHLHRHSWHKIMKVRKRPTVGERVSP